MPSKIQLDENLWFLYICLTKSDYKNIDFNSVAEVTKLNPPAARMRFTRLKKQIESGTLIGTHGVPFLGRGEGPAWNYNVDQAPTDETGQAEDVTKPLRSNPRKSSKRKPKMEKVQSDNDTSSEDDIPLAKRRRLPKRSCLKPSLKVEEPMASDDSEYCGDQKSAIQSFKQTKDIKKEVLGDSSLAPPLDRPVKQEHVVERGVIMLKASGPTSNRSAPVSPTSTEHTTSEERTTELGTPHGCRNMMKSSIYVPYVSPYSSRPRINSEPIQNTVKLEPDSQTSSRRTE